jgi:pimeloyl-ACP methyl ester carboxylesterase
VCTSSFYGRRVRVRAGDVNLFFDVVGAKLAPAGSEMRERPTLLVLHGGPGLDHSLFRPELDALADVAQVIYLDHRGNGRSDRSAPERWTLDTWADDVFAFCDALEIERPVVYGASFGGIVALLYAARHRDHPAKLVLVSTTARMELDRALDAFERLGGPRAREVARRRHEEPTEESLAEYVEVCVPLYTRNPVEPERMARVQVVEEVRAHFATTEQMSFDLRGQLRRIRCPVLVIAGELDPITPPENGLDIARELPPEQVRYELVPNAGHGFIRDAPDVVLRLTREFILAEEPASSPAPAEDRPNRRRSAASYRARR